jgi:hypothetical protein
MSKYYSVIREGKERWISMPNNGGELGPCPLEIMEELNRLIHQRDEANERIKRLEEALDLVVLHCSWVHHSKKHQHKYGEPCPVVALIEKAKEAKP